jgi:hypothetical protein
LSQWWGVRPQTVNTKCMRSVLPAGEMSGGGGGGSGMVCGAVNTQVEGAEGWGKEIEAGVGGLARNCQYQVYVVGVALQVK